MSFRFIRFVFVLPIFLWSMMAGAWVSPVCAHEAAAFSAVLHGGDMAEVCADCSGESSCSCEAYHGKESGSCLPGKGPVPSPGQSGVRAVSPPLEYTPPCPEVMVSACAGLLLHETEAVSLRVPVPSVGGFDAGVRPLLI